MQVVKLVQSVILLRESPIGSHTHYFSLFRGGSVEIACAKELGIQVQGYDVFDILTNYWSVQIQSPNCLAERLNEWEFNSSTYDRVKKGFAQHWEG